MKNRTGIEDWILAKAQYRLYGTNEKFLNPYDIGWRGNVKQVISWNCIPPGDGIYWPVIEGCDQFTLTVSFLQYFTNKHLQCHVVYIFALVNKLRDLLNVVLYCLALFILVQFFYLYVNNNLRIFFNKKLYLSLK